MSETYLYKTIRVGNCTVEIYRPILSDEERKKREEAVVTVLTQIIEGR